LYRPVLDQYRTRYDHSAYLQELPQDKMASTRQFQANTRWIHNW
jgi:hypothetical protein